MSTQTIGRYEITGELGRGAMGVVYRAVDPNIGRTVALKTLRYDLHGADSEEMLRRFKNEARAAGAMNHPNIVTIYDAHEADGLFYIAMEFVEGDTLQARMREGRLTMEQIANYTKQICAGLDYAHKAGVVHRDIKPANILLTSAGLVKITDFGIAKAGAGMTSTGQVLGTPNYMSPEQVCGKKLDGRSDLFSLGVMLYEMTTGEKPFTGETVTTVIYKIVNEHPIPPRELDKTIHPGVSAVVTKSLAKSPDERFQSGAELAAALENYKTAEIGAGTTTRLGSSGYDPHAATATSLVAAVTQAAAPKPAAAARPSSAAVATAAPTKKKNGLLISASAAVLALAVAGAGWYTMRPKPLVSTSQPQIANTASTQPPSPPNAEQLQKDINSAIPPDVQKTIADAQKLAAEAGNSRLAPPAAARVNIDSNPPGAKVAIDGGSATQSTPFNVELAAGHHQLRFTHAGYVAATKSIDAIAGKPLDVTVELAQAQGRLFAASQPIGAHIFIDGNDSGQVTPATIELPVGDYKVELQKEGFQSQSVQAHIDENKDYPFEAMLPRVAAANANPFAPRAGMNQRQLRALERFSEGESSRPAAQLPSDKGMMEFRSTPPGAEIMVQGRNTPMMTPGRTPAIPPGSYTVIFRLQGYRPEMRQVNVQGGQITTVDVQLQQKNR